VAGLEGGRALSEPAAPVPLPWGARFVVAACILAGLAAIGLASYLFVGREQATRDRDGALAAARQYAADLTTYDFATVDADFARFARHGTKSFQTSYAATRATARPAIVSAQSRALGTVVGAGLESFGHGHAVVLLAVDQQIRSARQTGPTQDHSRIRMTLVKAGDGWLISALTVF
jgi:Mce-associated membrane protein